MANNGSVTSRIRKYICQNIESGCWAVGSKIPSENNLCQELGVSRVSVRSALQQFIALGILESVHGKGTFLVSNDISAFLPAPGSQLQSQEMAETMKYILEFRCIIEPDICGAVAESAAPQLIEKLESLVEIMQNSVGNGERFVQADVDFHLEIIHAHGNPVISSVVHDIFNRRADLGHMLNLSTGYYGGIYYHTIILDAIKKHNGKRARSFMLEHLQRGITDMDDSGEFSLSEHRPEEETAL